MSPSDLFKWALSLGIGGALAFFLFMLGVVGWVVWQNVKGKWPRV